LLKQVVGMLGVPHSDAPSVEEVAVESVFLIQRGGQLRVGPHVGLELACQAGARRIDDAVGSVDVDREANVRVELDDPVEFNRVGDPAAPGLMGDINSHHEDLVSGESELQIGARTIGIMYCLQSVSH
jgi:hypothetical protein